MSKVFFPALEFFNLLVITGQMIGVLQEYRALSSIGKLCDIKSGMVGTLSHKKWYIFCNSCSIQTLTISKHKRLYCSFFHKFC